MRAKIVYFVVGGVAVLIALASRYGGGEEVPTFVLVAAFLWVVLGAVVVDRIERRK